MKNKLYIILYYISFILTFIYSIAVYLITRSDHFKGNELTIKELENRDNVHLIYNTVITNLFGNEKLEGIEIKTNEETKSLNIQGLFVAIGQVPETENFMNILDLDEKGYAITHDNRTKVKGIYVCGDIVSKPLINNSNI